MTSNTARRTLSLAWQSWISNDLDPHGPEWLQWLLTLLFCAVVAMCLTVLGVALNAIGGSSAWQRPDLWLRWFGKNLVVSCVIGFLIHTMFVLLIPAIGKARIRGWSETGRTLFFSGVPLVGVAIGWPAGFWLVRHDADAWLARVDGDVVVGILLMALLFSFVFFQIFGARSRQVVAERRALEAQLKLLQAQMEPHFLFNTLAGVQTLIDTDPVRAKRMLESFTDYLRATVGSLRTEDSTLAAELALAESYLALMRERMEDRLRYTVQADEGLQHARLPALMLQPLVENAIHHGLEPKVDGGTLRIAARRDGDALLVEVCDDGRGPDAPPRRGGHGVALDNLRQRLQGRWGDAASLTLAPAAPGTRATLRIPLEANETR